MSKLIVIDDDPTGSQTVHGCPLLLSWRVEALVEGLQHPAHVLFILANTRALPWRDAEVRLRSICRNLRQALSQLNLEDWQLVSRGDSTLRSHFPLDAQVLSQELGPFAVLFVLPAFLPGGRTTVGGHHFLHGQPVHLSSYARDSRFGYRTSCLAAWVEQKSGGRIPQTTVTRLHWQEDGNRLLTRLASLPQGAVVTVDASEPEHLHRFGQLMQRRRQQGHQDLCWGAASLIDALVDPGPQILTGRDWAGLRRRDAWGLQPGVILVGSHQPGADRQLAKLLTAPSVKGLEIPLEGLRQGLAPAQLAPSLAAALGHALQQERRTVALYTSRGERLRGDEAGQLALAEAVAQLQEMVLDPLCSSLGYVISKGGSTSDTLLRRVLGLDRVALRGQVMPGISLVQPAAPLGQAGLPVICVPGNMGTDETLLDLHQLMEPEHSLTPGCPGIQAPSWPRPEGRRSITVGFP
ncbi:MAG: four-carbon acid sugar kinase family protein [Cyanobacteria bacterium MAG IRC3_bin_20]|nr:four-carbon acid sugar kinase family protein [Cyanobacteria bacterium MAG IRC3_bin_20]